MKKYLLGAIPLAWIIWGLSGCHYVGEKGASLSIIYGAAAILSLLLLIGAFLLVRSKRAWIMLLFSSVLVVNVGYTFLSVASCLETALWANRISYLGSVFLPFAMLMIILDVTNTPSQKRLPYVLGALSLVVFLITASPGILPIYYKEVSFAVVNGVSTLVKVYGPLHPLYLVYLLGYFAAMVAVIIRAQDKKTIDFTIHGVILAIAVFVNIGVWFIEQITTIDFEMLCISYIISELFLLGVHLVMSETQRLRELVRQVDAVQRDGEQNSAAVGAMLQVPVTPQAVTPEQVEVFVQGLAALTPTEKAIYDAHVARLTSREIMAALNIKETTLKYHNRNLYGKLGVATRKELLEMEKRVHTLQNRLEEAR